MNRIHALIHDINHKDILYLTYRKNSNGTPCKSQLLHCLSLRTNCSILYCSQCNAKTIFILKPLQEIGEHLLRLICRYAQN